MPIEKKIIALVIFGILIAVLALFLPVTVINFTPIQYINASNITAIGAASTSDPYNMTNISEIDNLNFSLNEGTTAWFINITFTNVTNFSFIESKTLYYSNVGAPTAHEVDLEIWCIPEGKFVDTTSLTSHDEWWFFSRHVPDSTHFIDNGNVTLRFNHSDSGNTNHRLRIDTARLVVMQQFEKVNINSTINYITQGGGGGGGGVSFDGSEVNINGSHLWNFSINHANLTNLNGANTGHNEFDNLTLNKSILSAGRINITRNGRFPGTNEMLGSLDMMSLTSTNFNYLFYTVERWYNTSNSTSGTFEYGSNPGKKGALFQIAGDGFNFRTFKENSLIPRNRIGSDTNVTNFYSNFGLGNNISIRINETNSIMFFDGKKLPTDSTALIILIDNNNIIFPQMTGTSNRTLCLNSQGGLYAGWNSTAC